MRQLVIALFAMGLGCVATAQTTPSATDIPLSSPVASAQAAPTKLSEPLSATRPDNTRYQNDPDLLTDCAAQLSAREGKPCDIIFIGDSITSGWLDAGKAVWDKYYTPRRAFNFGISGDKTQNVLWRLNNMDIQNLKAKVAVIMIGGNNTENSPHEIADGIKAVLANTQAAFPGVKIILVSIIANEQAHDKMMQANSLIKSYADDGTVYFLNLVPLMPQVTITAPNGKTETNWKGLGKDRIHPDATGYQIWAEAMEPLLAKALAGG